MKRVLYNFLNTIWQFKKYSHAYFKYVFKYRFTKKSSFLLSPCIGKDNILKPFFVYKY